MELNIKRKVDELTLKPSEFLLPLFEVIANSIDAIHEANMNGNGMIEIYIKRNTEIEPIVKDDESFYPIQSFEIIDNGVGFNESNFKSFNIAYSEHKLKKGGKGVGRFTILKTFALMKVESIFSEGGKSYKREFNFDIKNGVTENEAPIAIKDIENETKVSLINYLPVYSEKSMISAENIAELIVEHCLVHFISEKMPEVVLHDDEISKDAIKLKDIYNEVIKEKIDNSKINDKNIELVLYFVHRFKAKGKHKICFTGQSREVKTIPISSLNTNFKSKFESENGQFYILVYVVGKYLDENVNEIRNEFTFPKTTDKPDLFNEPTFEELSDMVYREIDKKYSDYINKVSDKKFTDYSEQIKRKNEFIEYRHLISKKEYLDRIEPDLSGKKLDAELHRVNYEFELEHKAKVENLIEKDDYSNTDELYNELKTIFEAENEFSTSKLVNYLVRRKAVIMFFKKLLRYIGNSTHYHYEKELHNLIFPMGESNETIPCKSHNLWLFDENITFHNYIGSDPKLKKIGLFDTDSSKEPDLLLYDQPYPFRSSDQNKSVVIIEFKRPGRKIKREDYKQVINYFEILLKPESKDEGGRLLNLEKNNPKYGYFICDVDKELRTGLIDFEHFNRLPSDSLYKYYPNLHLHMEIISYDSMINNVEQRHRAFFHKLGIENLDPFS